MFDFLISSGQPWLYYILTTAYFITVVGIIIVVLSENRSPVKSLAWVTVLMLLPAVGVVLYFFFGRSLKNTRMISRRNRRRLKRLEDRGNKLNIKNNNLTENSKLLIKLSTTMTGAQAYTGNSVSVFVNARDKFDSLLMDLSMAEHFIELQYYIFDSDTIGTEIQKMLIDKARQGVKVRIIYDHVGSYSTRNSFFREMREAGIHVFPFFRVAFPIFGTRINWRNHRKLCVIDGRVGYIGGMNIADRYIDGGSFESWRDTHLRIVGPAVVSLHHSFAVDWNFMGQPLIEDILFEPGDRPFYFRDGEVMQLLTSGPTLQWPTMTMLYTRAIASSTRRVFLQTPYFLPTEGLLKALQSAAVSGVDVRIMIPEKSDSYMLTQASASYITECLQAGIKIYMYHAGMLHSKTMIVDDEFVSVGSTNFDFRSFEHNFEANMQVYSKSFNQVMADIFMSDIEHCHRLSLGQWKQRSLLVKMSESVMRLLSPIL